MRKISLIVTLAIVAFSSCNNSASKEESKATTQTEVSHHAMDAKVFQCPMDPHIIKDEAGKCPICEMELEQKTYHEALVFLSDFKKENPDYKEGDEFLKDLENHNK